jgi:hypothetical protein
MDAAEVLKVLFFPVRKAKPAGSRKALGGLLLSWWRVCYGNPKSRRCCFIAIPALIRFEKSTCGKVRVTVPTFTY